MPASSCDLHSTSDEDTDFGIDLSTSSANTTDDLGNQENISKEATVIDDFDAASKPTIMTDKRRNLFQHFKRKRDDKLTKRLSVGAQILDLAHQEIQLKKEQWRKWMREKKSMKKQ